MAKKFVSQPSKISARSSGPNDPRTAEPVKKRKSRCKLGETHYWIVDRLGAGECKHCSRKKEFDVRPAGHYHTQPATDGGLRTSNFGAMGRKVREEEA